MIMTIWFAGGDDDYGRIAVSDDDYGEREDDNKEENYHYVEGVSVEPAFHA